MSSKYDRLPDIARDQPDVYETPDTPTASPADARNPSSGGARRFDRHDHLAEESLLQLADDSVNGGTDAPVLPADADADAVPDVVVRQRLSLKAGRRISLPMRASMRPMPTSRTRSPRARRAYRTYPQSAVDALRRARARVPPLQRLARLQAEAAQLAEDIQNPTANGHAGDAGRYAEAVAQLAALERDLDEFHSRARAAAGLSTPPLGTSAGVKDHQLASRVLEHIKSFRESALAGGPTFQRGLYYTPETSALVRSSKLADMDARVHALERVVGHTLEPELVPRDPLASTIARLETHVSYLAQPRQLDALARQLKVVNEELAALAAGPLAASRAAGGGSPTQQQPIRADLVDKVEALYALVDKMDPLVPVVPRVLARLQALHTLHAEAGMFADGLRRLVADQARTDRAVRDLSDAVARLEKAAVANADTVAANVAALEERVDGLVRRIEAL
ncbi:hypothetical protein AMAG_16713 [Allomyces macrogynus ATCC 38327]|uniref:Dynactin subunit 2 n=1 Tax=Allomyces macrogynus (strain ATCC 38327) TaxID=578462 RepID=A0A0L0TC04_ALLM3|nr:hypothetical protein AMAG_16713 [Allomyces macrogynus ATCC 38327]|eukprot:KNE72230.1 hypothetical protein AMAG_16713 [Allomyces macrogynus ATCC 38327]